MKIFLSFIPILLFQFSFSQKPYNSKGAQVSISDLENKIYSADSTASAFFIYEKGFSRFEKDEGFDLVTDYEAKVKILDKEGYDFATIQINLYKEEKVKDIVAKTYNIVDGKKTITKLNESQIFRNKQSENVTTVKFALPNVKSGSVITYSYQIISPYKYKFKSWEFQADIPKLYSEYVTDILGNYTYNTRLIGGLRFKKHKSHVIKNCIEYGDGYGGCVHSEYAMDTIPAFKYQKYLTARKNFLSALRYELSSFSDIYGNITDYSKTWKTAENDLKGDYGFGSQFKKLRAADKMLAEELGTKEKSLEYAKEIFSHVKNNYKWDGEYFNFKAIDIKKNLKLKSGNVAEINMLLHNFLKSQDFEVYPVLLSTRKNGSPIKIHPVVTAFNYLIVKLILDEQEYLLDATDSYLSFGELPFKCLNDDGRLINLEGNGNWQLLAPPKAVREITFDKIEVTEDGDLMGDVSFYLQKQKAFDMRKKLLYKDVNEIFGNSGIQITEEKIVNQKNVEEPLKINFNYKKNAVKVNNEILLNPFNFPLHMTNPFTDAERLYPIDYGYKTEYIYTTIIKVPENYIFFDLPKNQVISLPDNAGKLFVNYTIRAKDLNVSLRFNIYKTNHQIDSYVALKELYTRLVSVQNNQLVSIRKLSNH